MYIVLDRIYIGMQPFLNLSVGEEQYDVVKFIENRFYFKYFIDFIELSLQYQI
jgi:hypothetical protein